MVTVAGQGRCAPSVGLENACAACVGWVAADSCPVGVAGVQTGPVCFGRSRFLYGACEPAR